MVTHAVQRPSQRIHFCPLQMCQLGRYRGTRGGLSQVPFFAGWQRRKKLTLSRYRSLIMVQIISAQMPDGRTLNPMENAMSSSQRAAAAKTWALRLCLVVVA